jgi:hypothetical protein
MLRKVYLDTVGMLWSSTQMNADLWVDASTRTQHASAAAAYLTSVEVGVQVVQAPLVCPCRQWMCVNLRQRAPGHYMWGVCVVVCVCVFVCVRVCVSVSACMRTCTHARMHMHRCAHTDMIGHGSLDTVPHALPCMQTIWHACNAHLNNCAHIPKCVHLCAGQHHRREARSGLVF